MAAVASVRKWYPVAPHGSIPVKEGRRVSWNLLEVALFYTGDDYLALDNQCPHKKGPLADGLVAGKSVFCPLHNWKISLQTGCALSGGIGQVKTYPVKIFKDTVYVAFEEGEFKESHENIAETAEDL